MERRKFAEEKERVIEEHDMHSCLVCVFMCMCMYMCMYAHICYLDGHCRPSVVRESVVSRTLPEPLDFLPVPQMLRLHLSSYEHDNMVKGTLKKEREMQIREICIDGKTYVGHNVEYCEEMEGH